MAGHAKSGPEEAGSPDDYLRVDIEAGPAFEPSPRLVAALNELGAALEGESEPEVAGYFSWGMEKGSFVKAPSPAGGLVLKFDSCVPPSLYDILISGY